VTSGEELIVGYVKTEGLELCCSQCGTTIANVVSAKEIITFPDMMKCAAQ
jgi:hypothetical protein